MTEQLKSAIMEAHGRGDIPEALRLLKSAIEQGDEQAKRVYDQLVEMGRNLPERAAAINPGKPKKHFWELWK
jgi:TPR repeat protein